VLVVLGVTIYLVRAWRRKEWPLGSAAPAVESGEYVARSSRRTPFGCARDGRKTVASGQWTVASRVTHASKERPSAALRAGSEWGTRPKILLM
jgi:hypothetical protein